MKDRRQEQQAGAVQRDQINALGPAPVTCSCLLSVLPLLRAPASCLSFVCAICGYRIRDSGLTMEDRGEVVNLRGHTARRQALQKYSPVSFRAQTRGKHS